jgi:hypothetical protein
MHTKKLTNILFVASLAVVPLAIFGTQLTGSSEPALSDEPQVRVEGPASIPQQLKGTIPPGGFYRFPPAPIAGTPEPNPTLTLQIAILDADTGQAVKADVLVNGVLARSSVDHAKIRLPGRTDGITVTVRADGYVPWSQGLRYKLDHSRLLYLQAELTPLDIQSGALPTPTNTPSHPTVTPAGDQPIIALASPAHTLPANTPVPSTVPNPPKDAAKEPTPTTPPTPPISPILPTPSPYPLTPTSSPTPIPSPTPTPSDPAAWWSWPCNTPRQEWPDGCQDIAYIAPPDSPITPPCIRTAYTRTVPNDDYPELLDIELVVVVDHPEYPNYKPGRATQFVCLVLQPAYGGWYVDHWQLRDPDWWFKCGIDEAPLAWALKEALNTRSLAPFDVAYNAPLPTPFVDLIADLLTLTPTPAFSPTPTPTPEPTVDSPLPTPMP